MPALKNVKHEQFCHELMHQTQAKAYKTAFPESSYDAARSSSSDLLAKPNVKNRFYELLRERQIDLPHLTSRFGRWLNDDDAPVQSWDAVKTGLKIYGILDDDSAKSNANMQNINIVITTLEPDRSS